MKISASAVWESRAIIPRLRYLVNQRKIFNPIVRDVDQEDLGVLGGLPIYSPFTVDASNSLTVEYTDDLPEPIP